MKPYLRWVLRIGLFILSATIFTGAFAGKNTDNALGEAIMVTTYIYMLYYGSLLIFYPVAQSMRTAWGKLTAGR